ncbi:hypothetical protein GCM10011581_45200 [Saccharopolyspora subtropica]|uniref:STAS domain-containing protein n=1 Tax=Saccharopolyspora thermophila TaxID=89367 RepID=A0A917K990_9PSEU|nr:STAS domain-containing protein [Saccharopolyspora subtropica]GGJ03051.1 hypothetical protein GCM10011581_45200 [Saccharopolyspora subtropica]
MSDLEIGYRSIPRPREADSATDLLRMRTYWPSNGVVVLETGGVLDMNTATRFAEAVRAAFASTARTVVLDLSRLSFVATDGVVVLLEAGHRALMRRVSLVLVSGNRAVDRLLHLLDVADRFTYAATAEAAAQAGLPARSP